MYFVEPSKLKDVWHYWDPQYDNVIALILSHIHCAPQSFIKEKECNSKNKEASLNKFSKHILFLADFKYTHCAKSQSDPNERLIRSVHHSSPILSFYSWMNSSILLVWPYDKTLHFKTNNTKTESFELSQIKLLSFPFFLTKCRTA